MILTTVLLSTSMTAPLFALLMLKIALRVPDDDTFEHLTMQMKSGVLVESDPVVLQYRNIAMVILNIARLSILMTALLFAVLMLKLAPRVLEDDTLGYIKVQVESGVFVQLDLVVLQYLDNV